MTTPLATLRALSFLVVVLGRVDVPPRAPASSFDALRPWQGTQSRAFEELSYQLLKSDAPAGTRAVRTGNPDGGVEWYATLPDATEHGWQAKHVHGIDALLTDMTASVKAVVKKRPALTHLTFVISSNLATSRTTRAPKSQRDKYEAKVETWRKTITGAESIEFDLVQESDLLDRLALPEHQGRRWFWWAEPTFGADWLQDRLKEQAVVAGPRYRPDLEVDVPIENDLKALGHDDSIRDEFERLRHRVVRLGRKMRLDPKGPAALQDLHREVVSRRDALVVACDGLRVQAESVGTDLVPLPAAVDDFLAAHRRAEQAERHLEEEHKANDAKAGGTKAGPDPESEKAPTEARGYSVRDLRGAASELSAWLDSSVGRAFAQRLYFLVGPAGSGKTHLFLDAARRALEAGRPAVVLFGQRFGDGNLWQSICDQLGLEPVGQDVLLGAMNAAGEAAGPNGRRFLILIDALNETVPPTFWQTHLPALRAAIASWPHVALAVSCRNTYVNVLDDGSERPHYVSQTHPGFAGREVEATQKYFAHYGLQAPRIPLLVPEFSLPLFLQLYCESLQDTAQGTQPVGHEGRVRIFERYLEAKVHRVARRFNPSAASDYEITSARATVISVVEALLDDFARRGREAVSLAHADALATAAAGGSTKDAAIILGALQNEGVLTRELMYLDGGSPQDGWRIVFQAFADFLILRRRLAGVTDPRTDADLIKWLQDDCSWGITEAAAVTLPELYGIELIELLGISPDDLADHDRTDDAARIRYGRAQNAYRSFVDTLPYRDAAAISQQTVDLLNQAMPLLSTTELFNAILQIAPQPANRLNADTLHRYLLQFPMPERDAFFGVAMYHEIWQESGPTATLARWASNGPYPTYDPKIVELACVPLVWLLSSSNRFMRDWVTKALVQLLRGHLDVLARLLDRFWTIDDPYVVQRLVVICYGALMASDAADETDAKQLAALVRKRVFTRPVRADELLLDAGRGVVEWGLSKKLLPKAALKDIKRPYGIAPPSSPPTETTIEKKFGFKEKQPDNESYSTIKFSVIGMMGDFGRYVIESGVHNFSRHAYGVPFPEPEAWPPPKLVKTKWKAFLASLTSEQREQLIEANLSAESDDDHLGPLLARFRVGLTSEQHALLDASWKQPARKRRYREDDYPADRAQRWVFRRTLQFGWTPQLFGQIDRDLGHGQSGREAHKAERWGKKYQWMAYHELLARLADNFQPGRYFDDDQGYEGLHQIIAEREIDPTLPPIDYRSFAERRGEDSPSWPPPPMSIPAWPPGRIDFSDFLGDAGRFLADQASEPTLDRMIRMKGADGSDWIVLEGFTSQNEPGQGESWRGLRQVFAVSSWFSPKPEAAAALPLLPGLRKADRVLMVDDHGHIDCCYAGEIGWSPHRCYHRHASFRTYDTGGRTWNLVNSTESVSWEGSLQDCSIGETVASDAPSTFLQARSNLVMDQRGPSWWENGELVLTNYGRHQEESGHGLLVRATWLANFMRQQEVELVLTSWHQRMNLQDSWAHRDPEEQVWAAARIDASLKMELADVIREQR